jgi:hypothetical protein
MRGAAGIGGGTRERARPMEQRYILVRQTEQSFAKRDLVRGLTETVEDQRLPVILISKL